MTLPPSLAGRTAIITGGSGAIGAACAERLAADGAAVLLVARRMGELEATRARLATRYPAAMVAVAAGDACSEADMRRALETAHGLQGRLDMIVATVGGSLGLKPLVLHSLDSFRLVIERNLTSAFLALRFGIPMLERGGSVTCISSVCASLPSTHLTPYCAAKAAVEAMVKGAAKECARLGIRVNAVRPGMTVAAGVKSMFGEEVMAARAREVIPMGRPADPSEVAEAVRYLATAKWVTGQSFAVDGGTELALNRTNDDADTELFGKDWPAPWSSAP
ncbi:SDR family NAD(P)-dependent oxidoreductase [Zavarzinia sp.]|uniref:SDR family NAD(P)-dependent oxidoreductase n=1 Tax=Zavarzinia sp. TaxID=2027920 RepID=UPI003569D4B7